MDNWNEEQQKFIAKLEETGNIFNEILTKDPNGMVIPYGEERDKLNKLKTRTDAILNKLKTREFTVAVVGLEKAGKSTLGDVLLKRNILPEYTARCTFTTTKICAGSEDKGEIFFYGAEEFKRDFADILKTALKYEQPQISTQWTQTPSAVGGKQWRRKTTRLLRNTTAKLQTMLKIC